MSNSQNLEFQKQQQKKETDCDCVDQAQKSWYCQTVPMFLPKVLLKITATLTQNKSCLSLQRLH